MLRQSETEGLLGDQRYNIVVAAASAWPAWRARDAHGFPAVEGCETAIIILLSVIFPLVGISLAAALLLDFVLLQRMPALRQALN
jgi:uncharacterized iron-regulated membrane protein